MRSTRFMCQYVVLTLFMSYFVNWLTWLSNSSYAIFNMAHFPAPWPFKYIG